MFPPLLFAPVDVGAQVAVIEGWDSNAQQRFDSTGAFVRKSSAFTGVEGSLGAHVHGRNSNHEVRALGRYQWYTPFDNSFSRRDGMVGLSVISSTKVGWRSMLSFSSVATLGSVNASRGTDAAPVAFDPLSARRVGWLATNGVGFTHDLERALIYTHGIGLNIGGTVNEDLPGGVVLHRGIDFFTVSTRAALSKGLTPRTSLDFRIYADRSRVLYLLDRFGPVPRNIGPVDSMSATHTVGVTHQLTREITGSGEGGGTVAVPRLGERVQLLPYVSSSIAYKKDAYSLVANVGFRYSLTDPRIGPGSTLLANVFYFGRPTSDRGLYLVLALNGSRTAVLGGASEQGRVNSLGGSITARYEITRWLGAIAGYDARWSSFEGPVALAPFVRHIAFIGISAGWSTELGAPPVVTLATNTPS